MKSKQTTKLSIVNRKLSIVNCNLSIVLLLAAMNASCANKSKMSDAPAGEASAVAKSEQKPPSDKKFPIERGSYEEEINMMGMELKKPSISTIGAIGRLPKTNRIWI